MRLQELAGLRVETKHERTGLSAEDELCRVEAVQPRSRPSIWAWTAPGFRSAPRNARAGPDQTGRPSTGLLRRHESAATGDTDPEPSAFAQRVDREARRRGFPEAGDPRGRRRLEAVIEIVDLFHAKGSRDAAKAIYGPGTDPRRSMGPKTLGELEAGRIDTVVETLGAHKNCQALRCMGYLETNRNRMRYSHR